MSLVQPRQRQSGKFQRDGRSSYARINNVGINATAAASYRFNYGTSNQHMYRDFFQDYGLDRDGITYYSAWPDLFPSSKKRKISAMSCESTRWPYQHQPTYPNDLVNHTDQHKPLKNHNAHYDARLVKNSSAVHDGSSVFALTTSKRDRSRFEDDELVFMSRDEIERCSPSRKDGIDQLHETQLRYSYCAFLRHLGLSLDLPQTTIGTAMVLCHRFFVRRSHASHDRFLIATAVLFLASKSEETPRALNDILGVSCQILHNQDITLLSYKLPSGWFQQYRERIIEAEQLILTTLNFELNVQHPFESLTVTLKKLGFQQSVLVNLALHWASEGLRSLLWLQFKPHQIAAGAAYLASKNLNMDLVSSHDVWSEFHTKPSVLKDVAHQLMELV